MSIDRCGNDALALYCEVADQHRQAIEDARWNMTHGNADNISAALVAIDGAMDNLRPSGRTADLDRIAQQLAEQKLAGTARHFDDVESIANELGRSQS